MANAKNMPKQRLHWDGQPEKKCMKQSLNAMNESYHLFHKRFPACHRVGSSS